MAYIQTSGDGIECDFPGCERFIMVTGLDIYCGNNLAKMIKAIGWTSISFPPDPNNHAQQWGLDFCPKCKNKDVDEIKEHDCVYMRITKKGKISDWGQSLKCYFCGKIIGIEKKKQ